MRLMMNRYTISERIKIVKIYYENDGKTCNKILKIKTAFLQNHVPTSNALKNLKMKFEESGSVENIKNSSFSSSLKGTC